MPGARHTTHTIDPVYAPPVLRAPSPTDSISTEYGEDETPIADRDLPDAEFARRVEEEIGLRRTKWTDVGPPKPIILPRTKDSKEEAIMFERVMANLRKEVKALEEEELFQSVTLKNPGPAFTQQPSARDVDAIMRSMLPQSNTIKNAPSFGGPISRTNGDSSAANARRHRYGNLGRGY